MIKKLLLLTTSVSMIFSTLSAVEYDGEKSYLQLNVPFQICVIPPSIEEAKKEGLKPINLSEAKVLYSKGAVFYDARDEIDFGHKKIKGAFHVKFDSSKGKYVVINLPIDNKKEIVFYCYGGNCANSYEAAIGVKKLGYKNVYWFQDGFAKWYKAKYPME